MFSAKLNHVVSKAFQLPEKVRLCRSSSPSAQHWRCEVHFLRCSDDYYYGMQYWRLIIILANDRPRERVFGRQLIVVRIHVYILYEHEFSATEIQANQLE